MKRRLVSILLVGILIFSINGCGSEEEEAPAENSQQEEAALEDTEGEDETASQAEGNTDASVLVAYFTYGENADLPEDVDASSSASIQSYNGETTGNTGLVAHMISAALGADLFSIQTTEPYPDNYDDTVDQGQEEQRSDERPQLASQLEGLDGYDTIFLGYPNWWGDMPMAVYTFLETYDLSGKTVIPFVTSGGSGFSGTVEEIESLQPDAQVEEGIALGASEAAEAQGEVEDWLDSLGY